MQVKILLILVSLIYCLNLNAKDFYYQVEGNDQLGVIFLSIGYRRLWTNDGQVNLFKRKLNKKFPKNLFEGSILKINEADILFKKNILIEGNYFKIINKIKTLEQYDALQNKLVNESNLPIKTESIPSIEVVKLIPETPQKTQESVQEINSKKTKIAEVVQSFNIYPGLGGFFAKDLEKDRLTTSSTFSGLQPMLQFKGIYSHSEFGSIAIDILAKKIINNKYSFPVNTDFRLQVIPEWNFTNYFRIALSHSIITHSYVGKNTDTDIAYKLKSNFIGLGFVVPKDNFWFELFFEKAYKGQTSSNEATQEASSGLRIDSEIVYPISNDWRIIPGLNYYQLKQNSTNYSLSVFELRTVLSRSFEF